MNNEHTRNELLAKLKSAQNIVVIQADNPDADSLGSALALEQILSEQGKTVNLYCAVEMPSYLHYLSGWSRVEKDLPTKLDLAVIVDAATNSLIEKLKLSNSHKRITKDNTVVIDHHAHIQDPIEAAITCIDSDVSSTGELLYNLFSGYSWDISTLTGESLLAAILGDTQGLSNNLATPNTFRVVANLLELGVDRGQLEEKRRQHNKLATTIYRFKAELINRTELHDSDQIACVVVEQKDINAYSPLYNPAALIQPDMLQIEGVKISIVFKSYADGKITAAIRCNNGTPIAAKLALQLGGGGHDYASGFKVTDGRPFNEVKSKCLRMASDLLANV